MTILRTTWRGFAGIVAALAMLASLMTVPVATVAAQADVNTYTFASGQVLAWSGSWALDPESVTQEEGLEMVLLSQQISFLAVISVPAGVDMDSTRDAFLDGFLGTGDDSITIDRGSYGAVSYSLDTINYDGIDMGAFTLFRSGQNGGETFAWVFVSLVDSFAAQFAQAQSAFTLDGNPPFTGIDGQGLQDQLASAVASGNVPQGASGDESGGDGTDDVSTPEDDDPGTSGGGGGLKGSDTTTTGDDATAEADVPTEETDQPTEETDEPTEEVDDTPSGEVGLVDDSTYLSPAYGVTLEWDANFILDSNRDPNPSADTSGVEIVGLASPIDGSPYFLTVNIAPTTASAADYATVWSSDEFLAESAISPDAEVLLVEGNEEIAAVVLVDYLDSGLALVYYYEFHVDLDSGTLVMIRYNTAVQIADTVLPLAQQGVTVDGAPILTFFSTNEVMEALAGF